MYDLVTNSKKGKKELQLKRNQAENVNNIRAQVLKKRLEIKARIGPRQKVGQSPSQALGNKMVQQDTKNV